MRRKDTSDVLVSAVAVVVDAVAVFAGFMLAVWLRFNSGWVPLFHNLAEPPSYYHKTYAVASLVASGFFLLIFRSLGLYIRPQLGRFEDKIPRLVRATGMGVIIAIVLASLFQNAFFEQKVSSVVFVLSFLTISVFIVLERYILYRIEWNLARHSKQSNRVLILGVDQVASHLSRTIKAEPLLRSNVVGFLNTRDSQKDPHITDDLIKGDVKDLETFIENNEIDQIIAVSSLLNRDEMVKIILLCEQNLITFNMVPDVFSIMTSSMDVQALDDIPMLGIKKWPLDVLWNRLMKRVEDIAGALVGLILSFPVVALAALLVKKDSLGPAFFVQERCGESGKVFRLYKLRTMCIDAEADTGPVWTSKDDARRTKVGSFLRKYNIDELPQFWNVLKGEMSLVGPRPERPHFVEQFKTDVGHYMWRHVSKPGLTGWAQVNGLRGNTSIEERIKYDLYYLENWSVSFDFKILIKTLFARENAY